MLPLDGLSLPEKNEWKCWSKSMSSYSTASSAVPSSVVALKLVSVLLCERKNMGPEKTPHLVLCGEVHWAVHLLCAVAVASPRECVICEEVAFGASVVWEVHHCRMQILQSATLDRTCHSTVTRIDGCVSHQALGLCRGLPHDGGLGGCMTLVLLCWQSRHRAPWFRPNLGVTGGDVSWVCARITGGMLLPRCVE